MGYAVDSTSGQTNCCELAAELGGGLDGEFAATLDVSDEADLFASFLVAEAAQSNRLFPRFWHEPRGFNYGLRVLAPGALNHVPRKEVELTHTS